MGNPKVSVIMNCLNCAGYLREAIDSVYAQTFGDWEIIFWDNASKDESAEIARSYDGRLKYFRSDETVPLGKARNYAIEKVNGEYIAFLDCDDRWAPPKIERQLAQFSLHPDALLVYSGYYTMNEEGKITGKYSPRAGTGNLLGRNLSNYEANFQTVMLKRSALDPAERPYFDVTLEFAPDYNLIMWILGKGASISLSDILVYSRKTTGSLTGKTLHRWGIEVEYAYRRLERAGILEKLSTPRQRERALAKSGYYKALHLISKSDYPGAGKILGLHKFAGYRYFLLYLLSCSPLLWKAVHDLKR